MPTYEEAQVRIRKSPPGKAGFIGSHLLAVPEGQGDWNGVHHA
jgi:hypothetical protein